MMEYEPVGVLSTEVERLKEGILAQLQALRWQVVDFTVSDALRAVSDAGGVVELRLQVYSDVWREKSNEAERENQRAKAEEEERAKREEAERQTQDQQRISEAEERQRTLEKEENEENKNEAALSAVSIEEELRLRREWEALKEKARQKVFDEVRREQDQRMLFALNLRESFGLKKTSEPRHMEDYSLPFEMPTYADDPFPVGAIAPAMPTIAVSSSSPFGSPRIAAEAVDTLPLARGADQSQQQQHGSASVRVIALHTHKPTRNWQAELRPGLVFIIDARLGNEVGPTTTTADSGLVEEWWIGRKFGNESGPRRAVPAGLVHVLHGDARELPMQSLDDLLRQEGIEADREVVPIAAPAQHDARQVLPRPAAAPAGAASESGEEQKQKNEAAEALKRESEKEAEREKVRLLAQEEQERKAREAAEELRKRQAEEEDARRKRQAETERKAAAQEKAPNTMPPADHKDGADKSRAAITAGAYNMMPVPVMSSEIEAAIKERGRRKSANLGAEVMAEKPEASRQRDMERDRRRSATAAVLMQQQHQPLPQTASEQLRPPPPSRSSRRSLDPSAAPLTAPPEAEGGSAPPPLPPLPSALPPPASAIHHLPLPASAALARDKRLSLPAHVLLKRNEEAIAAAAAAAGPPPALPPMSSGGIGAPSGQQTVSASALPTNPRTRAVAPASAASSDALSTRGDRRSWAADDSSAGPLASSASSVPTAAASVAKLEARGIERQRSATVLGPGTAAAAAAVPQRTTSSSALLRAQTLRPSKSSSGGSKDKLDKEVKKKDKEEKKKKKDEEKEKKRKEKEKKKEDKKKKKG